MKYYIDHNRVVMIRVQEKDVLETVQPETGLETKDAARTAAKATLSTMGE